MEDQDFADVIAVLQKYQPVAVAPERAARIAAALAPKPSFANRWWPVAATIAFVIAGGGLWMSQQPTPVPAQKFVSTLTPDEVASFKAGWETQPRLSLPYEAHQNGVTIVVFLDWLCPGCIVFDGDLRSVLEPLMRQYPGRIFVIYEDWPWDATCNSALTPGRPPVHEGSCILASAVRRARERGRDRVLIDWIKAHQSDWRAVGLPVEFAASSRDTRPDPVQESIDRGKRLRIVSTPTAFINGVRVDQIMPANYIDLAVRLELERTSVVKK